MSKPIKWFFNFAAIAAILINGCAHLPAQSLSAAPVAGTVRICLVRGFQDWYSQGIDDLADELRRNGFVADVYAESQWKTVSNALQARQSDRQKLVLIGFSYGADDVIQIARQLSHQHQTIQLLILLDPVTPSSVPANVVSCVNFYESNPPFDALPFLRGVPIHREKNDPQPLQNIDIRARPDLLEPGTSHATIAGNKHVHQAIINLMKQMALGK